MQEALDLSFDRLLLMMMILEKYSNSKFHENPLFPCVQSDGWTDGQRVMTNLIVAFCNFANASKINDYFLRIYHSYLRISFRCSQYLFSEIGYT